jgi:N-methylhydantoinase A
VHVGDAGFASIPIYERASLPPGTRIEGPAIVHQVDATTLVPAFAVAEVDEHGNIILTIEELAA